MTRVAVTVDFEPDCPPYLSSTFRGIEEGAPRLLELLATCGVPATYFCTGEVAERYPDSVADVVRGGHELGCHGVSHTAFDTLDRSRAEWEIASSSETLREFASVTSFRAPYLRFPERYVSLLETNGFTLDSSHAKYKRAWYGPKATSAVTRIAASITSSALRLPAFIRNSWLAALTDPVVLFVHPWEFVDLTAENLRWDCRLGTGEHALASFREAITFFQKRGATFHRMNEFTALL